MNDKGKGDDLQAVVQLRDGRKAWRDGRGRYRDQQSGRFLRASEVERLAGKRGEKPPAKEDEDADNESNAREQARRHLLEAVRALGLQASSAEDAWGSLVAVQARIALDEGAGSKATAAAKLVAQATGLLEEGEEGEGEGALDLDAKTAEQLLKAVLEEQAKREESEPE